MKLKKIKKKIKDKVVFILGSAPNPDLSLYSKDYILASINGSAKNAKELGLNNPTITLIDFELINKDTASSKDVRSIIIKNKVLKNLDLGDLIAVQSNNTLIDDYSLLEANINSFFSIHRLTRKIIVKKISKNKNLDKTEASLLSTGGFLCALSFYLGAKEVVLSGFSFLKENGSTPPVFYKMNDSKLSISNKENTINTLDTRSHSLSDSCLIASLIINGYKISSREKSIMPLIQNWGNPK
tara:strand:- start:1292 stop:2014 length:723 start_codon:yes stop_codon:yes gene_type:complete